MPASATSATRARLRPEQLEVPLAAFDVPPAAEFVPGALTIA
jgi:hypothetical protein